MLTKRQNFLETIRGGKPDRFVKQYEALHLLMTPAYVAQNPIGAHSRGPAPGGEAKNDWGVTIKFVEGHPGPFPMHDDAHKVLKDVTKWKSVVKMPRTDYPPQDWEQYIKIAEAVDRKEKFCTVGYFCGLFEQTHYLMGIDDCLAKL
ncbi:hypothetical protein AGMMS49944_30100 [Spirochaetia bacterium]|nr:hypothetical protein AGMMS49944_30100 [Spirochaetia bacterium]